MPDPVTVTVNPGKRQAVMLEDVPGDETLVTIINDGLDSLRITVNGQARVIQMRRGETRKVDISGAMQPGDDNTIILFDENGHTILPLAEKLTLARQLISEISKRIDKHSLFQ